MYYLTIVHKSKVFVCDSRFFSWLFGLNTRCVCVLIIIIVAGRPLIIIVTVNHLINTIFIVIFNKWHFSYIYYRDMFSFFMYRFYIRLNSDDTQQTHTLTTHLQFISWRCRFHIVRFHTGSKWHTTYKYDIKKTACCINSF